MTVPGGDCMFLTIQSIADEIGVINLNFKRTNNICEDMDSHNHGKILINTSTPNSFLKDGIMCSSCNDLPNNHPQYNSESDDLIARQVGGHGDSAHINTIDSGWGWSDNDICK